MDVSVVIVNYKLYENVVNLCRSFSNEKTTYEIIIVDNSCDNNEKSNLVKLKSELNCKLIFNEENLGFGKACNIGVKASKGKYVFFINPDAYILPGCLDILYSYAQKNNADAIGPKVFLDNELAFPQPPFLPPTLIHLFFYNYFPKLYFKYWYWHSSRYWNLAETKKVKFLSGSVFLIKRDLANFDERFFMYFEDADLFMRLKNIFYCPEAKAVHYFDISPSCNKSKYFAVSNYEFINKYYWVILRVAPFVFKKKKFYIIKNAVKLKEALEENKFNQNEKYMIALSSDFIPFTKGKIDLNNLPMFIKNNYENIWIKKI